MKGIMGCLRAEGVLGGTLSYSKEVKYSRRVGKAVEFKYFDASVVNEVPSAAKSASQDVARLM